MKTISFFTLAFLVPFLFMLSSQSSFSQTTTGSIFSDSERSNIEFQVDIHLSFAHDGSIDAIACGPVLPPLLHLSQRRFHFEWYNETGKLTSKTNTTKSVCGSLVRVFVQDLLTGQTAESSQKTPRCSSDYPVQDQDSFNRKY